MFLNRGISRSELDFINDIQFLEWWNNMIMYNCDEIKRKKLVYQVKLKVVLKFIMKWEDNLFQLNFMFFRFVEKNFFVLLFQGFIYFGF